MGDHHPWLLCPIPAVSRGGDVAYTHGALVVLGPETLPRPPRTSPRAPCRVPGGGVDTDSAQARKARRRRRCGHEPAYGELSTKIRRLLVVDGHDLVGMTGCSRPGHAVPAHRQLHHGGPVGLSAEATDPFAYRQDHPRSVGGPSGDRLPPQVPRAWWDSCAVGPRTDDTPVRYGNGRLGRGGVTPSWRVLLDVHPGASRRRCLTAAWRLPQGRRGASRCGAGVCDVRLRDRR